MRLGLTILYRGTLSSCNYDCPYCPFGKHWESTDEQLEDRRGLERFVEWSETHDDRELAIFFTPWGEALVRHWYRDAIVRLSHVPHVRKVAVQTNLSCQLDWLRGAKREKLGFWCTFHPGQTAIDPFLSQCQQLEQLGVRFSVGCVGLREHQAAIAALRERLAPSTYLWVNAYKSDPNYYDQQLLDRFASIDPLFEINTQRHASRGRSCRTGSQAITVDSRGDIRRCHFVDRVMGNLYEARLDELLVSKPCPNDTCGCHIGYVHLEHLQLDRVFGDGLLERVPRKDSDVFPSARPMAPEKPLN